MAVNLGGSCGGVLYCVGAMVEFVSGRKCWESGLRNGFGLRYWRIDGGRTPSRREARMATREMKRAIATSSSRWKEREIATVALATYIVMWGRAQSAV